MRRAKLLPTTAVINIMVVPVNMTFIILHQKWERISKGGEVIEKSTKKGESYDSYQTACCLELLFIRQDKRYDRLMSICPRFHKTIVKQVKQFHLTPQKKINLSKNSHSEPFRPIRPRSTFLKMNDVLIIFDMEFSLATVCCSTKKIRSQFSLVRSLKRMAANILCHS